MEPDTSCFTISGVAAVGSGNASADTYENKCHAVLSLAPLKDNVRSSEAMAFEDDVFDGNLVSLHKAGAVSTKDEVVVIANNYVMQMPRARKERKSAASSHGIVVELYSSPAVDSGKLRALILQLGPCGEVVMPYVWATLRVDARTINTLLGVNVDRERFEETEGARPCMAAAIADKHRDDFRRATPEKMVSSRKRTAAVPFNAPAPSQAPPKKIKAPGAAAKKGPRKTSTPKPKKKKGEKSGGTRGYDVFMKEQRRALKEVMPDATFGDISKAVSGQWQALGEEGQGSYKEEAASQNFMMVPAKPTAVVPFNQAGYENAMTRLNNLVGERVQAAMAANNPPVRHAESAQTTLDNADTIRRAVRMSESRQRLEILQEKITERELQLKLQSLG